MDLEDQCFNEACWANGYHPYTFCHDKSGFKTNALIHSHPDLKNESVAEDFLANSKLMRADRENEFSIGAYFSDAGLKTVSLIDEKDPGDKEGTPLESGVPLKMELGETLVFRRSKRHYTKDPLDFAYLSTLIRAGFGVTAKRDEPLSDHQTKVPFSFRTAPSPGGLYSVSTYIAILNVKGMKPGIYRYGTKSELLTEVRGKDHLKTLLVAYGAPSGVISSENAAAIFLLVGEPWRTMRKYGPRGLKFVYHEAGSIAQNIHLSATALGVSTVDCASFYDDDIHKILKIDGINQTFLSAIFVGLS